MLFGLSVCRFGSVSRQSGCAFSVPACFKFAGYGVVLSRIESCIYKPYLMVEQSARVGYFVALCVIRLAALHCFAVSCIRSCHSVFRYELYLRRSAFDRELVKSALLIVLRFDDSSRIKLLLREYQLACAVFLYPVVSYLHADPVLILSRRSAL